MNREEIAASVNGIGLTSIQDRMTLIEEIEKAPPGNVLEIGIYLGGNLILAGKALQDLGRTGTVFGVDPLTPETDAAGKHVDGGGYFKTDPAGQVQVNLVDAGIYDRVVVIRKDSKKYDAMVADLSVLIIDGCHTYDYVLHDLLKFSKWVKPGGVILAHDYNPDQPGWKPAFDAIHEFSQRENWPFENRGNFAIFRKPEVKNG